MPAKELVRSLRVRITGTRHLPHPVPHGKWKGEALYSRPTPTLDKSDQEASQLLGYPWPSFCRAVYPEVISDHEAGHGGTAPPPGRLGATRPHPRCRSAARRRRLSARQVRGELNSVAVAAGHRSVRTPPPGVALIPPAASTALAAGRRSRSE